MRSLALALACVAFAACGSGGGDPAPAATVDAVRLDAAGATIGSAAYDIEIAVRLALPRDAQPVALAATIELPPELTALAPELRPAGALVELERGGSLRTLRVLAGDTQNVDAAPLAAGPLFWLRVAPSLPRTRGRHRLAIRDVDASTRTGERLPTASAPVYVDVVVE